MSPSSAKDNAPTWAHALAGQVAGMVGLAVVHPVDTLKIRIQANGGGLPVMRSIPLARL